MPEEFCAHAVESMLVVIVSFVPETIGDVDWKRKEVLLCSV
jgi:hypothetical protein